MSSSKSYLTSPSYRSIVHASHPALKLPRLLLVSSNLDQTMMIHLIIAQFLTLLAIAMFVLFVAVCEIITYELSNVLDSNHWPLEVKVKNVEDSDEIWRAAVPCIRVQKWTLLGPAFCSQYIIRKFRDRRTNGRAHFMPAYAVQLRRNGVIRRGHLYTLVKPLYKVRELIDFFACRLMDYLNNSASKPGSFRTFYDLKKYQPFDFCNVIVYK